MMKPGRRPASFAVNGTASGPASTVHLRTPQGSLPCVSRTSLCWITVPSPWILYRSFQPRLQQQEGGLKWPLDVFGVVAVRDSIDYNRSIVFCRTRDNCQTLTEKDPYLVLTGPSRAVMLAVSDPVTIEVELKLKGSIESEDKDFSSLVAPLLCGNKLYSRLLNCAYISKLATVEFTLGYIVCSVEATIFVRVIRGSWPDGLRGQFAAFTTGIRDRDAASIDHEKIVLLDSRGEKVPLTADGKINLSRCVVSVETRGELKVSVKAWKVDNNVVEKRRFSSL